METNEKIFIAFGVVLFLLLVALAAALYKLCKIRALAEKELLDQSVQVGRDQADEAVQVDLLPKAQFPHFQLEKPQLELRNIPIAGLEGCILVPEGILGVEPGVKGPNWQGNVIVVDPGGSIFQTCRYTGSGASGALYSAIGVFDTPVNQNTAERLVAEPVVVNQRIFRNPRWQVRVVHVHSPDMSRLPSSTVSPERALRDSLYRLFLETFCTLQRAALPGDSIIMMPLVASGIYSGNIPSNIYNRAFASAFCAAARALRSSNIAEALGVREVRICCYGRAVQLALAEEMERQACTGKEGPAR
ncbi:conserved hypothetical protein [Neorickettsia risticii str. Illinois]|uniref:Macro domain-containing protein n=1 Tax=Neorickettsia risticii (strain Illinois) TaxID=434131 RepID=C6V3Y5_NEORI|nr:hypothetical protein [Neorickettsia risticii]ACT69088.1 conserved hypothetical protein [Neorickettsia risticii str. Illinois]